MAFDATNGVYFGTRQVMQWVSGNIAVNYPGSKVSANIASGSFLSGGAFVRNSVSGHKEFSVTWNPSSRDDIRTITDYADGLYGPGPFYWLDPFAWDKNLLPQYYASPFQGIYDGPIWSGAPTRPVTSITPANGLLYPTESATYTVSPSINNSVYVPIPPGFTAWVGVHGSSGGGNLAVTPYMGPTNAAAAVAVTMQTVTDPVRFSASFDGSSYVGILLNLQAAPNPITLSGVMVQVLPTGITPAQGAFISGQGHSGLSFKTLPNLSQISTGFDRVSIIADFVETGAWL
jgi:hypothetical protein